MAVKDDKLPWQLEAQNMLLCINLWWQEPLTIAHMLWSDARDRRRRCWRVPRAPRKMEMYCMPSMAPIEQEAHLWDRGVPTGGGTLMWEAIGGVIQLRQWFWVPGRQFQWADYCARRAGFVVLSTPHSDNRGVDGGRGPVPPRGPQAECNNWDMWSKQLIGRLLFPTLAAQIIGRSPQQAERRLRRGGAR